jgi:xylan 1,4-beta-xylosidase
MFGKMTGERLAVASPAAVPLDAMLKEGVRGEQPDVGAMAAIDVKQKRLAVLVWHYHDDDLPGPDASVDLTLVGLPAAAIVGAKLEHYRIDQTHSNAFSTWKAMGSERSPTPEQQATLERAGALQKLGSPGEAVRVEDHVATVRFNLPRQGVSLVVVTW